MYIISGCNGAGKTTASYTLLPDLLNLHTFVNADEIADELSLSKSLIGKVVGRLKEKGLIEPVHVHGGVDDSDSVDTPETQQRLPFKDD